MSAINDRLASLGITLPALSTPSANYIPVARTGNLLYVSGQVPVENGTVKYTGKLGADVSVEDGQAAARLCAINIIAHLSAALDGDLGKVARCVRLGGFVNATPDFPDPPKVINGASDLIVEVFGEAGRHARAAVGCATLPRNVAVEVDAIFEVVDGA
ncbi:RidA family protein [Afifella pfennigii]|uniref:RidA family protein n=1 Tax=Afifella pfennigii TaxID=209897 RepID=UPI00047CF127|nr:RidA family protein [Afifella pfennigii]